MKFQMKRKNSHIHIKDPCPIRSSFSRGFSRVQGSKTQSKAIPGETQGYNVELQVSPLQRNQAPISDDPKTSEFAFFKKLKEDAGHKNCSHSLHQIKDQSAKFNSNDCVRERIDAVVKKHNDIKSTLLPENVSPNNFVPFLSPLDNSSMKSGLGILKSSTTLMNTHSALENSEESGDWCSNIDIFTRKRQKLRQLTAKTLFPEVDILSYKGCDIVSALLSKLLPESNDNKSFGLLETNKSKKDTKSRFRTSPESDMDFGEYNWVPKRNCMELERGPSLGSGFLSYWLEIPGERVLPNPSSPDCHFQRTYLDNRMMDVEYELEERTPRVLPNPHSTGCRFKRTYLDCRITDVDNELPESTAPILPNSNSSGCYSLRTYLDDRIMDVDYDLEEITAPIFPNPNSLGSHFKRTCIDNRIMDVDYELEESTVPVLPNPNSPEPYFPRNYLDNRIMGIDYELEERTAQILPNSNSRGCHFKRTYLDNRIRDVDYELREIIAPNLCTEVDSAFDFHINRQRSLTLEHLEEFDEFQYPIKALRRREPQPLLLGGELHNTTNRELSLCPILSSSYSTDQQQYPDNNFTLSDLNMPSVPFSPSSSDNDHNLEEGFQVKDDIVTVINNFPLSLTDAGNDLNLSDYSHKNAKLKDSMILLSPQNHVWLMKKVQDNEEALFSPGLDFDVEAEWEPTARDSLRNHSSYTCPALELPRDEIGDENANCTDGLSNKRIINAEDMCNMDDWSTFYYEKKVCPLLLDKSCIG